MLPKMAKLNQQMQKIADSSDSSGSSEGASPTPLPPPLESCVGLLETGEATIYDSRLLHCGGANRSHERTTRGRSGGSDDDQDNKGEARVLFYITFRCATANAATSEKKSDDGNTATSAALAEDDPLYDPSRSILPCDAGKFHLRELRETRHPELNKI